MKSQMYSRAGRMTRGTLLALVFGLSACADDAPPLAPPISPRTPLDVVFCRGTAPEWVAFQDGDGTWTRAQPIADGARVRFHHDFSTNTGAIATTRAMAGPPSTALEIQYGAVAELAAVGDTTTRPCADAALVTLTGTVSGLEANDVAVVTAGFTSREMLLPDAEGFKLTLLGPPAPPQDILATRARVTGGSVTVTGFVLRRAVPRDRDTLPVFDFNAPEAFQPTIRNLTITGLGPDELIAFMGVRTAQSVSVVLPVTGDDAAATRPYYGVPASRLTPADLQFIAARAVSRTSVGVLRRATVYFRAPVDATLAFGGEVLPPDVSIVAAAPTVRPRAHFATQAEYDRLTMITYRAQGALVSVAMTDAYARLTGNGYDLFVPELTGVAGFDPQWALPPGRQVEWSVVRIGGTLGLGLDAVPTDGATQLAAELGGSIPAASLSPGGP